MHLKCKSTSLTYKILFDEANGDSMRHILVVNSGSLLEQGLARLLAGKDGLDVLSIDFISEEALVEYSVSVFPDVLIVNRVSTVNLAKLLGLLAGIPALGHLQVLAVGVDSNMIDVYENRQIYELHARDFYGFLQGVPIN